MEALAIFSIACNVMQTINFAHETISIAKSIYHKKPPKPELAEARKQLSEWADQLHEELQKHAQPLQKSESELLDVAKRCRNVAKQLEVELNSVMTPENQTKLRRVKAVVKAPFLRRRLKKFETTITDYQRTLETQILVRVSSKSDALDVQQQEGFDQLNKQLRGFIQQFSRGHTSMVELINTETAEQINALELRAASSHARERLLGSLKYPAMNARKNQIAESYPRTYHWFLGIEEKGDLS